MKRLYTTLTVFIVYLFLYTDYAFYEFIKEQTLVKFLTFTVACIWTYIVWLERRSLKERMVLDALLNAELERLKKLVEIGESYNETLKKFIDEKLGEQSE